MDVFLLLNMKNSRYTIFLIVSLFFLFGFSQTNIKEVNNLITKAKSFRETNTDSALLYTNKAHKQAIKSKDINAIAHSIIAKTSFIINKGDFEEAEKLLQQNLDNQEALDLNQNILGPTYFNLGSIAHQNGKRDQAIQYYLNAVNTFPEENYRDLSRAYLGVGAAYEASNNITLAEYFYNKSFTYSKKYKNANSHSGNLPLIDTNDRIKSSLHLIKNVEQNSYSALCIYEDLAEAYYEKNDYENAIINAQKSIAISKENSYNLYTENCDFIIAKSLEGLHKYNEAINKYKTLLNKSSKIRLKNKVLGHLMSTYKAKGDHKNALYFSEIYKTSTDSINLLKENQQIAEITARYETEKQAKEILELKQINQEKELLISQKENKMWRWSITALLMSIIAIWLGGKLLKSLNRIKTVEKEKDQIAKKVEEVAIVLNNKSKIYLDTLKYIKSDGNYLEFVTNDKTIIDRNKLKAILDDLPPNFIRTHRSYIINKNHIISSNSTSVFINPNIEIPLSRTFKSNLT